MSVIKQYNLALTKGRDGLWLGR